VEAVVAVGESTRVVARVVGAVVVPGAEQDAVGQVGAAASCPGVGGVVGFAPGGRDRARLGPAPLVTHGHGLALARGEQPAATPQVEYVGPPTQHDRDDLRRAGEPTGLTGADRLLPH